MNQKCAAGDSYNHIREKRTLEKTRLLILDSHGILFRAFFALGQQPNPMTSSQGELTYATYGYAESLLRVIDQIKPTHICAAWDAKGKTFRHELYPDYKATRKATPPELIPQMERVRELLEAFSIPIYELAGFEADDIAGTIAAKTAADDIETWIATLDSDLIQLIEPNVNLFMFRPYQRDTVKYDESKATERYGFSPRFMIDYKALRGDTSDNIPGVKGIGEKTATKLIQEFGSVESIYSRKDEITPQSTQKKLMDTEELALANKTLVTIVKDVPIDFNFASCELKDFDQQRVISFFNKLEFHSLVERIPNSSREIITEEKVAPTTKCKIVRTQDALSDLGEELVRKKQFALMSVSTTGELAHKTILGIAFATDEKKAWYIPLGHAPRIEDTNQQLKPKVIKDTLGPILTNPDISKITYEAKYLMHQLQKYDIELQGVTDEIRIMSFLTGSASKNLEQLVTEKTKHTITPFQKLTGKGRKAITLPETLDEQLGELLAEQVTALLKLREICSQDLNNQGITDLYETLELPLLVVLFNMEQSGIALDHSILYDLSQKVTKDIEKLSSLIYELADQEFNIASPQQLSEILFKNLGLPPTRKLKQGFSTDQRALESLRLVHPIIDSILEYRQLTKLKSTYLDSLPSSVANDGRIHSDFQQTITATGRLSSANPNLQNIPVRTELGREIRKAFQANTAQGAQLIGADYSQIELRVLAHASEDEGLIEAFLNDEDIHTATAAKVFSINQESVTKEMRSTAKMINFGIIYGMGEFGLSSRTGLSRADASEFIETYYQKYPGIKRWQEQTLEYTRKNGYAETLLGRRRYLPGILHRNFQVRTATEREAINMPIQGTAADIIKVAMIKLHTELQEKKLSSKMVLQVHDELIYECPKNEVEIIKEMLARIMPSSLDLAVPLKVDLKQGTTWASMQ